MVRAARADGAWARTQHREVAVAACPTDVVDTVGAGDTFTAAMLVALDRAGLLGPARRTELESADETQPVSWWAS